VNGRSPFGLICRRIARSLQRLAHARELRLNKRAAGCAATIRPFERAARHVHGSAGGVIRGALPGSRALAPT
jgi:hypothetical protein